MANFFASQRESLKVTSTEIAARCGTTANSVRGWELDRAIPTRVTIDRLAKAYEVSIDRMSDEISAQRIRIERRAGKELASAK